MSSGKSAYLEAAVLDHVFGRTTYTAPATVYYALSLSAWDPLVTGTALDEPTDGAYARVALTNDTTSFPAATGANPAVKATGVAINFPAGDFGLCVSWAVLDAATDGNVLYGGDLPVERTVVVADPVSVPAGSALCTEI